MNIILQAATYLDPTGMTQEQIVETVGRTCYKSEDKITPESADKFVASVVKNGHHAMIEFGFIYLKITDIDFLEWFIATRPRWIRVVDEYAVGNFRAFYDWYNAWLNGEFMVEKDFFDQFMDLIWCLSHEHPIVFNDLYMKLCEKFDDYETDEEYYSGDVAYPFQVFERDAFIADFKQHNNLDILLKYLIPHIVKFTTNRAIAHELNRHRKHISYAMESTRYCDYSKDKFGNQITVIEPLFDPDSGKYGIWKELCERSEIAYFNLIQLKAKPEEARGVLPLDLKCDVWAATYEDEWQWIINLRMHEVTGHAHPQFKSLMQLIYPELCKHSEGRIK